MPLQIASGAPAGAHPARLAKDVAVQRALDQEGQRCVNHMRRVFLCAALRDQRLVGLLQLRLRRHVAILRFRGGGDIFHILVFQHVGFWRIAVNYR